MNHDLEVLRLKAEERELAEKIIEQGTAKVNQQNEYLLSLHATALSLITGLI
jgi:hypothetical protein